MCTGHMPICKCNVFIVRIFIRVRVRVGESLVLGWTFAAAAVHEIIKQMNVRSMDCMYVVSQWHEKTGSFYDLSKQFWWTSRSPQTTNITLVHLWTQLVKQMPTFITFSEYGCRLRSVIWKWAIVTIGLFILINLTIYFDNFPFGKFRCWVAFVYERGKWRQQLAGEWAEWLASRDWSHLYNEM